MRRFWPILVGVFSVGILLIPDVLPVIDEAGAVLLLIWAIKQVLGKGDGSPPPTVKPPEKTVN